MNLSIMTSFGEAITALRDNPLALAALMGTLALIVFVINMRKIRLTPLLMAQIAMSVALAAVLNNIILYRMPQGGSVTLASVLPILIMSYAYGPEVGMLTGFLFGIVNLFMGPFIIHPFQTLLDYPVPFMLIGVAGYFRNRYAGAVMAHILRLIPHVLSGVIFFAEYAPEGMNSGPGLWWYSITYNAPFILGELAIILVILAAVPWTRLLKAVNRSYRAPAGSEEPVRKAR